MSKWEQAKRAQTRQLLWVIGLFSITCSLLSWRYIVSASSAPQVITRAPMSRPRVVMFDISDDAQQTPPSQSVKSLVGSPVELANDALYQSLISEKRWDVISLEERDALLDPAWTRAPITIEEALELGRETGADWALQAQLEHKSDFYRVSFKLIALTPQLWTPSEQEIKQALRESGAELSPEESAVQASSSEPTTAEATPSETEAERGGESPSGASPPDPLTRPLGGAIEPQAKSLPPVIDFNTLDASELVLVEHISWVTEPTTLKSQFERVGKLLFVKAQNRLERNRSQAIKDLTAQKVSPQKRLKPRKLSTREREAQELNRAAQRELNDIQARLDAEYQQRREEERIKREVLAQEAEKAWSELERISGGAGILTTRVEVITQVKPPRGRWGLPRPLDKPLTLIKPALVTWDQVKRATENRVGVTTLEHKDLLLSFIHQYKEVPSYRAHVEEARARYTWLNRPQVEWTKVYGHDFPVGGSLLAKDDTPVRWVKVKSFEISISEVTNAQYKRCVDAKVCTPPHWDDGTCEISGGRRVAKGPLPAQMRRGDLPVVCVDWDQSNRYAAWVGGRLLSESEWEFAARSGDRYYKYPWGRQPATCALAVMNNGLDDGCGYKSMLPACSKPRGNSSARVCDLAGNVWEWVADGYRPGYQEIPSDGSPFKGGETKVIRGGSFVGDRQELSSTTRGQIERRRVANIIGLRVARDLPEL